MFSEVGFFFFFFFFFDKPVTLTVSQLLKQLHNRLHAQVFTKRQDPFSVFPLEIVHLILQYFEFKQIAYVFSLSKNDANLYFLISFLIYPLSCQGYLTCFEVMGAISYVDARAMETNRPARSSWENTLAYSAKLHPTVESHADACRCGKLVHSVDCESAYAAKQVPKSGTFGNLGSVRGQRFV